MEGFTRTKLEPSSATPFFRPVLLPYRSCPRFASCSVNHCPLDPQQDRRQPEASDTAKKCGLAKSIRVRIGREYPELLPLMGMTRREHAGQRVWASLGALQQAQVLARGREALKRVNSENKGNSAKTA
jgi:hypothetical protein